MPRGDRTGPWGAGPMTGRGGGYCANYAVPGYMNPVVGYGRGWGRGRGRGFGRRLIVYPQPTVVQTHHPFVYQPVSITQSPEQEVAVLENYQKELEGEKAELEQEMGGVKARIEELKAKIKK